MKRKLITWIGLAGLAFVCVANFSWAGINKKPISATPIVVMPKAMLKSAVNSEWHPNPTLLNKLGEETKIDAYKFRLPLGYSSFPTPDGLMDHKPFSDGEIKAYQYKSSKYPDGIHSVISYHIFSASYIAYINNLPGPPSDTKSMTESWVESLRAITLKNHADATFSREEYGQLSGLNFIRLYIQYTGTLGRKKFMVHRFTYVSINTSGGIEASFYDSEPHSKVSFPIAEASTLTLYKD